MVGTKFNSAMKELPEYIRGYDSFNHKTPDDLAWMVLIECDLYKEGEESEIRTTAMLKRCEKYVAKWQGIVS